MDKIVLLAELRALRATLEAAERERDALGANYERARADAADAAALRRAFERAVAEYPAGFTLPEPVRLWWARFYEAIRDHTAGLALLAELERLKGEGTAMKCPKCLGTGSHGLNPYELAQRYGTGRATQLLDALKCGACNGTGWRETP